MVSVKEKAWIKLSQVRIQEMNVSEPLLKCRKSMNDVKTEGWKLTQEERKGNLSTACVASGIEAA